MIRGWFTEVPSVLGRDGMHIPESGLGDLICHGDLALESAGSEVLAGAGVIGDSIGTADTRFMGATGISPAAPRFTTGAISTGVVAPELTQGVVESTKDMAEPTRDTLESNPAEIWPHGVMSTTVRGQFPDLLMETSRLLEDTRNPAARAACAPAPSVALIMEAKPEASRRADSPALEAAADSTAVEAVTAAADGVSPNIPW